MKVIPRLSSSLLMYAWLQAINTHTQHNTHMMSTKSQLKWLKLTRTSAVTEKLSNTTLVFCTLPVAVIGLHADNNHRLLTSMKTAGWCCLKGDCSLSSADCFTFESEWNGSKWHDMKFAVPTDTSQLHRQGTPTITMKLWLRNCVSAYPLLWTLGQWGLSYTRQWLQLKLTY